MSETLFAMGLVAAFWMGYLLGCGVKLALRAARYDLLADEKRAATAASAEPWARDLAAQLEADARASGCLR